MRNMWKKVTTIVVLCVMLIVPVTVGATEETEYQEVGFVYDGAGLLTDEEIVELENQIASMKENTDWDIFAVTTDYAEGKSAMEYADDFYDARTEENSNGILVLIDMDNREIYLSTSGMAIRYLTDERIEEVLDDGYYYVSDAEYASCLSAMLQAAEYYYDEGIEEHQYNYDVETGAVSEYRVLTWMEVVPILLLSVGVGLAIFFGVKKSYSLKGSKYDYPYMKYTKLDLTDHEDRFIRQYVTHQRIQTEGSSGGSHSSGRSSVHTSSRGRSHGGGGRKF